MALIEVLLPAQNVHYLDLDGFPVDHLAARQICNLGTQAVDVS